MPGFVSALSIWLCFVYLSVELCSRPISLQYLLLIDYFERVYLKARLLMYGKKHCEASAFMYLPLDI